MSTLCTTLAGNKCPLLTVTNFAYPPLPTVAPTRVPTVHSLPSLRSPPDEIERRRAVFVSARVHPGETCASWAMHGFLEFLCGLT